MLHRIVNVRTIWIVPLFQSLILAAEPLTGQFSGGVNLVEVYATVTDRSGEPILGLVSEDFTVSEDSEPQRVTTFAAGEFPLSVVVALDRSFSMAGRPLALAKEAAQEFIGALRPKDDVTVLAIGSEVQTITPHLPASQAAATRWDAIDAWGTTPLYDVMLRALNMPQTRPGRTALLLVSDGVDRDSRTTATELIDRARQGNVLVYPIAVGQARSPVFAEIAAVTGGRSFFVKDPRDLRPTLAGIARELRFQYLLGYSPARPSSSEPQWRSIDVTVDRPGARVRARDGYVSR